MDLQTKVKLKNSQLTVRRHELIECFQLNLRNNTPHGILLTFVIIPFIAGFAVCRLKPEKAGGTAMKWFRLVYPLVAFAKN